MLNKLVVTEKPKKEENKTFKGREITPLNYTGLALRWHTCVHKNYYFEYPLNLRALEGCANEPPYTRK